MATLVCPASLGDTMIVCALAKAFKQKHGGELTVIMPESHTPIGEMYAPWIDTIVTRERESLIQYCRKELPRGFNLDYPIVAHPWFHGDGRCEDFIDLFAYRKRGGVALDDLFRHCLHLPWDSAFEKPVIPLAWRNEAQDLLPTAIGNTVVLFPDNNSIPTLHDEFWTKLTRQLIVNGWDVVTNLAGNNNGARHTPFDGSVGVKIPLHLAIPFTQLAGRVISGNNGMYCLLKIAKTDMISSMLMVDQSFSLSGRLINHPIPYQSFQHMGYSDDNHEYVVPADYSDDLITQIARNEGGYVW